ncbi:MAG: hypothetical protein CM1200mP15_13330 [Dehalococcoidia bacterium]|nr:MAG: hypothetical protein CM1200mP15_13330 [Dehalococcoidia bacterium]
MALNTVVAGRAWLYSHNVVGKLNQVWVLALQLAQL